jgi:hypothetical protein
MRSHAHFCNDLRINIALLCYQLFTHVRLNLNMTQRNSIVEFASSELSKTTPDALSRPFWSLLRFAEMACYFPVKFRLERAHW